MGAELLRFLAESSVAGSAALLLVLALRKPVRGALGAGAAYALWWLPAVTLVAVLLPTPVRVVELQPVAAAAGVSAMQAPQRGTDVPWRSLLLAGWGCGALLAACLQLLRQRRFQRELGPLRALPGGLWQAAAAAGLPAVIGVLRPRIVLPNDFERRYSARERALILRHERTHIRRGDLHGNALAALLACVYWFNPLLHYALRRYRHDQELACDARVIARHPAQRRRYAEAMFKTLLDPQPLPVGCHWPAVHPIKERIAMLKKPSPRRWQSLASVLLAATLSSLTGYAAWAAQPARAVAEHASGKPATKTAAVAAQAGAAAKPAKGSRPATLPDAVKQAGRPRYPASAAEAGVSGRVVLIVDVAADGRVADVRVESSQPQGVFDQNSLAAVQQWKFVPALENCKVVPSRVRVPIDFEPDAKRAPAQDGGIGWYRTNPSDSPVSELTCDLLQAPKDGDEVSCGLRMLASR